ncbi:MAG: hypothetical protein IKH75_10630 [Ruminococcus sp.]|nr:hypothetical protein [Ruminococcus sp.]
MKKFICISNFQEPSKFQAPEYEPADNEKLRLGRGVHYPLINVINAYVDEGEDIELITVVSEYDNAKANYETLIKEVDELAVDKGLKVKKIRCDIPYGSDLDIQLEMFEKLIACMSDEDKLFCDITYGTKVMSQILTMAVNYGYRVNKDVTLGCITYGEVKFEKGQITESKIYDITSLNYLDEIVRMLAENKVKEPLDRIRVLLKWGDEDEE